MLDFTTFLVGATALFGVLAGEAALNQGSMRVNMEVPQKIEDLGISADVAESIFLAEAVSLTEAPSVVPAPRIRVGHGLSPLAALAEAAHLDGFVEAVETAIGKDQFLVNGTIIRDEFGMRILLIVEYPGGRHEHFRITSKDGDAVHLIRKAAGLTMEKLAPYRTALSYFVHGFNGDPDSIENARVIGQRYLESDRITPLERSMFLNLDALIDLNAGRLDQGCRKIENLAKLDLPAEARTSVFGNAAFCAIAGKDFRKAKTLVSMARAGESAVSLPGLSNKMLLLDALVDWQSGDLASARTKLQTLTAGRGGKLAADYLTQLVASDPTGQPLIVPTLLLPGDDILPALAISLYRVDPENGGLRKPAS